MSHSGLGYLMGSIPQQLPAVNPGAAFQFGYNVGYFNNQLYTPDQIAPVLEAAGLTYNTTSYAVSGYLNPYLAVEGNANTYWSSGTDFGNAIYNAIAGSGFPIDAGSIQFRVEAAPGAQSPPPLVGTPYPTQSPSVPQAPGGGCNLSQQNPADWLACQLGVTPTLALVVGGVVGAALLFGVLKR